MKSCLVHSVGVPYKVCFITYPHGKKLNLTKFYYKYNHLPNTKNYRNPISSLGDEEYRLTTSTLHVNFMHHVQRTDKRSFIASHLTQCCHDNWRPVASWYSAGRQLFAHTQLPRIRRPCYCYGLFSVCTQYLLSRPHETATEDKTSLASYISIERDVFISKYESSTVRWSYKETAFSFHVKKTLSFPNSLKRGEYTNGL